MILNKFKTRWRGFVIRAKLKVTNKELQAVMFVVLFFYF